MLSWQANYASKIYFGANAVEDSADAVKDLGRKALIVIGQGGSARKNGALDDICKVLQRLSIPWEVFDQVEANPSIETARKGARVAKDSGVDFIINAGGGSPMDAGKAIAILAVNELDDDDLLNTKIQKALPMAAIPTTAGTGSEVTPYSILTFPSLQTKRSIASPLIIPKLAILDPLYTYDLPYQITVDTAVDAYSHALESFLSVRTTPLSDLYAREALRLIGPQLIMIARNQKIDTKQREVLLYGSMLAGMAISTTGTSIPHAMGYYLTYFKGIAHGRANGMTMPAYMAFNAGKSSNPKVLESLELSGFDSLDHFQVLICKLCGRIPECSPDEKLRFIEQTLKAKNAVNNIVTPNHDDIEQIINLSMVCK